MGRELRHGVAPDALVTRATAAGSGWKLLVVTVSGCSDSVNSIPYVASFLDKVPSIEMRLISPTAGKAVQEAHRTPDGRAATPTVILLDGEFNERGCWIERPANLIALMNGECEQEGQRRDLREQDGVVRQGSRRVVARGDRCDDRSSACRREEVRAP